MKRISIITLTTLAMAQSLQAETIREINQTELRLNVTSGKSVALGHVLSTVRDAYIGDPVDVRAFDAGCLHYRILVKNNEGRFRSVIVDATSGAILPSESPLAQKLAAAATRQISAVGQDDPSTSLSDAVVIKTDGESGDNT